MKKILLSLILTAFALPVHAAQMTIEERDDVYIIEYRGDSSGGKATEPEENPAAAASGEPQEQYTPVEAAEPAPAEQPVAEPAPVDQPTAQPEVAEPAPE
jgi:hypothetical protein